MDAIAVIDQMITETNTKARQMSKPVTGGGKQAPFDGELLGRFIRFVILHEVRDRLTGEKHTERQIMAKFNPN